ncbi:macrolide ABC transporter ATP-binding protein [Candidatus Peregrinibacteria bacterium CG_4_9_14_0_2_um_filter_53_11]|nr:MAG: macrolide ABC transporter ATP-binding protein [Candidatus Peregrinibacteria bacterium CG_4_9_14_0_2_um_filter_53_11]
MALIELTNLEKVYRQGEVETRALRGVSFSVEKGEFVAIMGPSGSGKSTLLHILGFLDPPTGGEYLFQGRSAVSYGEDEISHIRNRKLGFVFQAFNLLPRTTVLDNVMLPLLYSDVPEREWKQKATKAVEAVGLSHRIHHEPAQLSGGEKQRVAIARALVTDPEVIFADEPTGNLDSKSGKAIMEILQELNDKQGHTIILITHETYTAEHAGRIIRIKDGLVESDRLVEERRRADTDSLLK